MTTQFSFRSFGRSLTARILLVLTLGALAAAALLYQSLCEADRGFALTYAASALLPLAFSTHIAVYSSFQNQLLIKLNNQMENIQSDLEISNNKLRRQAERDPLTGLKNRRYFFQAAQEILVEKRSRTVLALDVDRFKIINDTFGHEVGDHALCLIADTIRQTVGSPHVTARMGGEEFAVLLDGTKADQGYRIAERIRSNVEQLHFEPVSGSPYQLSISIGVCNNGIEMDAQEMLYGADMALLDAKKQGRNQSVVFVPCTVKSFSRSTELTGANGGPLEGNFSHTKKMSTMTDEELKLSLEDIGHRSICGQADVPAYSLPDAGIETLAVDDLAAELSKIVRPRLVAALSNYKPPEDKPAA